MKKELLIIFLSVAFLSSCSYVSETAKVIWGSSTRALENARDEAAAASFRCDIGECFDAVVSLTEEDEDGKGKYFDLFLKNKKRNILVLMKVSGVTDTTEVGVFFEDGGVKNTRIEVVSLSPRAQRVSSKRIFDSLLTQFSKIQ